MPACLAEVCRQLDSPSALVGGVSDHVQVLSNQSKNISSADLIGEIKRESSKWIKSKGGILRKFYWQSGYGVFSVSQSQISAVKDYIRDQEEHHRPVGFKEEFRKYLKNYEIEYDER